MEYTMSVQVGDKVVTLGNFRKFERKAKPTRQYTIWDTIQPLTKTDYIKREFHWRTTKENFSTMFHKMLEIVDSYGAKFVVSNKYGNDAGCVDVNEQNFMESKILIGEKWVKNRDNALAVVTVAHELGHWVDIVENFEGSNTKYIRTIGTLEGEVRAWELAIDFLHQVGFTFWEELNVFMEECLGSYYTFGTRQRDRFFGYTVDRPFRNFQQAKNDIMARAYYGNNKEVN